jgi:hypothetical protein
VNIDSAARPVARLIVGIFLAAAIGVNVFSAPFDGNWTARILILAACVIVPLGLRIVSLQRLGSGVDQVGRIARAAQFLCALLLAYALLQPQGRTAALLAGSYLAATAVVAVWGLLRAWQHHRGRMGDLCIDVGLMYLAVGGFWAVLDRAGLQPLGFDPAIVLLTAVHFHYAGFTLLLLTGLAAQPGDRLSQVNCIAVVVAVPLVAVGITTTQLGFSPAIECPVAWGMAIGGLLTAVQYFRMAFQSRWPVLMRSCWAVVAVSLVFSMWLAVLYGSRAFVPVPWLDIPWMRALHGSANSVGVGLAGVLGWTLAAKRLVARRRRLRLRQPFQRTVKIPRRSFRKGNYLAE